MKFVVSNATPIRYLTEIEAISLLPYFFQKIIIPTMVLKELTHSNSPEIVHDIIVSYPKWFKILKVTQKPDNTLQALDPGEQEAIILAGEIHARIILLDDKNARREAEQRGFSCIGTLRILAEGAKQRED